MSDATQDFLDNMIYVDAPNQWNVPGRFRLNHLVCILRYVKAKSLDGVVSIVALQSV